MRSFGQLFLTLALFVAPLSLARADEAPQRLTDSALLTSVARELSAHYSLQGDLQLELLRAFVAPAATAQRWDVRVLEFPSAPASNLLLRCQLIGDDLPRGETVIMVRASLWRDAWSTRQGMVSGANFDPAQLATQRVDFFRDRDAIAVDATDFNSIFARGVPANRILTHRDLARRPLVRKGDLVEITATDGLLSVTLQALALQNGAAGEVVSVRNVESRKTFNAIVTDEKRAQLRL